MPKFRSLIDVSKSNLGMRPLWPLAFKAATICCMPDGVQGGINIETFITVLIIKQSRLSIRSVLLGEKNYQNEIEWTSIARK